jgi:hypothetical protein
MLKDFPIGIDDFRKVREARLAYVDKSHLIREVLDLRGAEVVLLPRPRRFGKTLNLSMLRCFFEKREEDLSPLFEDLRIWQAGDPYRAHFQRYPVLHMTFKGTAFDSYERCWGAIREKIADLFNEHRYVLEGGRLNEVETRRYREILDGTAPEALYDRALLDLSAILHRHHGERVVILIDEYDEPIHTGYLNGYAPKIVELCRAFLGNGLKGNPHLFKAVLTGILRVARESIFSGLNNVAVYSLLASEFNTCFGFTGPEVVGLLEGAGRLEQLELVRAWYDGYLFGGEVIYNPWSVLNFLQREREEPKAYWLSTSSNDLVRSLLERRATKLEPVFETLLEGGSIEVVLDEHVALGELDRSDDTVWSLLVFAGYLKAEVRPRGGMQEAAHRLSIPNFEVRKVYTSTFREWLRARMCGRGGDVDRLTAALLGGDERTFEEQLQAFAANLLSFHDPGTLLPEQVYQGFVVGLLATLEPGHQVRSNRESGHGRADILIRPTQPGRPGVVLELKVVGPTKKTPSRALDAGLAQIRDKGYAAELAAAGAAPVHAFAVAFDGKRVWVKAARAGKGKGKGGEGPMARATKRVASAVRRR